MVLQKRYAGIVKILIRQKKKIFVFPPGRVGKKMSPGRPGGNTNILFFSLIWPVAPRGMFKCSYFPDF
jgi:hypothetical protein